MIIDLRSDTVTKPSKAMLEAMMQAKVGDDVFREDETVNLLESRIASTLAGVNFAYLMHQLSLNKKIGLKKANIITCLDLKDFVYRIKSNPSFVFKFKYISNTIFRILFKKFITSVLQVRITYKNIIFELIN